MWKLVLAGHTIWNGTCRGEVHNTHPPSWRERTNGKDPICLLERLFQLYCCGRESTMTGIVRKSRQQFPFQVMLYGLFAAFDGIQLEPPRGVEEAAKERTDRTEWVWGRKIFSLIWWWKTFEENVIMDNPPLPNRTD